VRANVGKQTDASNQFYFHTLGQCARKELVSDCTTAVQKGPALTVYYSSDRLHPVYDMIYKLGNTYFAFQVTLGKSHDVKQWQINDRVQLLQIGTAEKELRLYHDVHEGVFDNFVTEPASIAPAAGVTIFHLKLDNVRSV
jgi:hypothetical protein